MDKEELIQRGKELVERLKHLQGKHNQLTHGYRLGVTPSLAKARQYRDSGLLQDYLGRARERQGTKPSKGRQENKPKTDRPAGKKVGDSIDVQGDGLIQQQARDAIDAINLIHGDGDLSKIPLKQLENVDYFGEYKINQRHGDPEWIGISSKNDHAELTTAHEIGHFIDFSVMGTGFKGGSEERLPEFSDWETAIESSGAVQNLKSMLATPNRYSAEIMLNGTKQEVTPSADYLFYSLSKRELWARSYAQYIATKSGNSNMVSALKRQRDEPVYKDIQWDDEDFKPISAEIDKLFKARGWIQ